MTDYTSLQAKVNDLKAKVDSNSISPSYVGALLDDFISIIKSSDQEEDVAAALQNAATALTLARSSSTKADNARATANAAKAVTDTKGAPNGIASLDGEGRIPLPQLPVTAVVALPFDGTVEDVAIYAESPVTSEAIDALKAGNLAVVFDTGCNKFRLRMSGGDAPAIYFSSWIGLVGSGKELPGASEYVNGTIFLNTQNDAYYTRPDSVSALRLLGSVSEFEKEFRRNGALTGGVTVEHQANSVKVCIPKVAEDGSHSTEDAVIGAVGVNAGLMLPKHVAAIEKSTEDIEKLIGEIDTLLGEGASSAIDTFNEVEKFLAGVTDSETLTGLLTALKTELQASINGKVDKVTGKGLSANDYTDADRTKLGALPTNTQLTQDLASKLNASVWNDAHEQFSIEGSYWSYMNGEVVSDAVWKRTPRIPLNRDAPIILKNVSQSGNAATCFFDEGGNFISAVKGAHGALATIEPSAYPGNAVFVGISTRIEEDTTYSNGDTVEAREGAVADAIQAARMELFIDQWNSACGIYGKYNADTGYFELNGLVDITYKEAVLIYANRRKVSLENFGFYAQYKGRTNLMPWVDNGHFNYSLGMEYMFSNCTNMEVARVNTDDRHVVTPTSMFRMFIYCGKLRKVLGVLNVTATTQIQQAFEGCAQLQEVQIRGLKIDLSLSDSPLLSLDSLSYLVAQSAASKPITVTVHPEVYAKLADASNAEWHPLMAQATAKQITFATTE